MPQLDKATFISQIFITGILFVVAFFVLASFVLPTLYKVQRARQFSFDEADWQTYVVCTIFGLTNYTKRTSIEILLSNTSDALEAVSDGSLFLQEYLVDGDDLDTTVEDVYDKYGVACNFEFCFANLLAYIAIDCAELDA